MIKFNPRAMMEKAIEVMRQSIAESRSDGKASPKVGAVLIDVGDDVPSRQRITTAYRGELREGDHAEYTVLERKCRDQNLDHCFLFATLEPCAPNARKYPKLGCAERIVNARIKKVWVGIADPDPTVDRKGIKYLQDNGVEVEMFDRDLQEIIQNENKEFFAQALERAAASAEEKPREVVLSPLESAASNSVVEDFSSAALDSYRSRGKFEEKVTSREFKRRLIKQGLLQEIDGQYVPTGFGILLFGKEPRNLMPQAGLLATIHRPDGDEETENFFGPQVFVPDEAIKWLRNKLPNVLDRTEARRSVKSGRFFELVREGLVNALVHRDYGIEGAKSQLVVFPDKIEIHSPGRPVDPITLEQMQSFDAPMLSRNPIVHFVFATMELAEERGLGLKSMKRRAEEGSLPLPKYEWRDPYLVLTLFPSVAGTVSSLPIQILEQLNDSERAGWQWLTTKGHANTPEYAKAIKVDDRTGRRHLQRFVELGLVRVSGKGRATKYELI